MPSENQTISLTSDEATSSNVWLNLEQEYIPEIFNTVSLTDLSQMISRVRSGMSAKTYKPDYCPVTIRGSQVIVPVNFYVWPSDLNLEYTLKAGIGDISEPEIFNFEREFDLIVPKSNKVSLDYLFSNFSAEQEITAYSPNGSPLPSVSYTYTDNEVIFSAECFCVYRVRLTAHGHKYTCTMTFDKGNYSITNIKNTIVASYGEGEKEKLNLKLPGCAEDILAVCEDDTLELGSTGTVSSEDDKYPVVYYSTCTGNVILLRYE